MIQRILSGDDNKEDFIEAVIVVDFFVKKGVKIINTNTKRV